MSNPNNKKILFGYLCYLNDSNKHRRGSNFYKSLRSMSLLANQDCTVVAINNTCSVEVEEQVAAQSGIDETISLDHNLWDVSVIYASAKLSQIRGLDYCCYMYDDFVVYHDNFIADCIEFMDTHSDVACLRIPNYSFDDKEKFDSNVTPKSVNPDALRHYNTVTNRGLSWEGPFKIGGNVFYKNNWHYTSRPTIWRSNLLLSFFDDLESVPVMQDFERLGCEKLYSSGLKTGVLDGGSMHTFLESERTVTAESRGTGAQVKIAMMEEFCMSRDSDEV